MANRQSSQVEITPEVLLKAYACGIFPMAESAEDPALYWIEPERRGVLPIERFHVPARLVRPGRADRLPGVCGRDFHAVIDRCVPPPLTPLASAAARRRGRLRPPPAAYANRGARGGAARGPRGLMERSGRRWRFCAGGPGAAGAAGAFAGVAPAATASFLQSTSH